VIGLAFMLFFTRENNFMVLGEKMTMIHSARSKGGKIRETH
jgi:hypothetical protein